MSLFCAVSLRVLTAGFFLCRILSVPVVNRLKNSTTLKLFGHPNILYLPSKLTGTVLYQTVDRVVPCLAYYTIHFTDGQVSWFCPSILFLRTVPWLALESKACVEVALNYRTLKKLSKRQKEKGLQKFGI